MCRSKNKLAQKGRYKYMYKILVKHNPSSTSTLADRMFEIYGSEVVTKTNGTVTTTFTPFETDDKEVLKAELLKLSKEIGNENIMVCEIVETTYGVEIADDEQTPVDPDNTTSGDLATP